MSNTAAGHSSSHEATKATSSSSTRRSSEALLLGRATNDGFADAWPERDGVFADKFNAMPKYVVGTKANAARWTNTTVLEDDPIQATRGLREEHEGDIVVHGSAQLAQLLVEHDLVDALHLLVYPVIVGAGKRLFGGTSATKRLALTEARTFGDGVHLLVYQRAA